MWEIAIGPFGTKAEAEAFRKSMLSVYPKKRLPTPLISRVQKGNSDVIITDKSDTAKPLDQGEKSEPTNKGGTS